MLINFSSISFLSISISQLFVRIVIVFSQTTKKNYKWPNLLDKLKKIRMAKCYTYKTNISIFIYIDSFRCI